MKIKNKYIIKKEFWKKREIKVNCGICNKLKQKHFSGWLHLNKTVFSNEIQNKIKQNNISNTNIWICVKCLYENKIYE